MLQNLNSGLMVVQLGVLHFFMFPQPPVGCVVARRHIRQPFVQGVEFVVEYAGNLHPDGYW